MRLRSAMALVLVLAACDTVADPIRAAQTPSADGGPDASSETGPNVPDTAHCAEVADWPAELAEAEYRLVSSINELRDDRVRCGDRDSEDLPPFRFDPALRCSARLHSKDMFERDYFDDDTPEGVGPSERIAATGLDFRSSEESIAQGGTDPEQVLDNLLERWDPCNNIRSNELTAIGAGHYAEVWTLDFAEL